MMGKLKKAISEGHTEPWMGNMILLILMGVTHIQDSLKQNNQ